MEPQNISLLKPHANTAQQTSFNPPELKAAIKQKYPPA